MRPQILAVNRIRLRQDALEGTVAVVVGGGSDLGREIIRALAALGASVVIADTSAGGLDTDSTVAASGSRAVFVETDISSEADVLQLARRAEELCGPVEILVNNAALCPVTSAIKTEAVLWDRVIAHNLRGAFLTCRAFLPGMLRRKRGTVVNVVPTDPMPHLAAASAASDGLVGLTKALAAEVGGEGVRVIAFAPGMVDTAETRGVAQALAARFGFAAEELLISSPHPAYNGLMPADHAAAAIAYLVAALADECQGQKVSGYAVLERAGLIEPMDASRQRGPGASGPGRGLDRTLAIPIEVALSRRLQRIIDDTEMEFNRLATYVRPLVHRSFEAKTEQTIAEWRETAANLTALLEKAREADGKARKILHASYPHLKDQLGKLIAYYHEAPAAMASLAQDASVLHDAALYSPQRETSLHFLLGALERSVMRPLAAPPPTSLE